MPCKDYRKHAAIRWTAGGFISGNDIFVEAVKLLEPTFGGINLEDIAAPNCFLIEQRIKEEMDIPVFHDDQHGTAIVTPSALLNALKVTGKKLGEVKVVVNGAGSAGIAFTKFLLNMGVQDAILCDTKGVISEGRAIGMNPMKEKIAKITKVEGSLEDVLVRADVFIDVSVAGALKKEMVKMMNSDPIILALANPDPEIMYEVAGSWSQGYWNWAIRFPESSK